jgi:hypothetical protein
VRDGDLTSKRELGRAIDEEGWSVQVMHPQPFPLCIFVTLWQVMHPQRRSCGVHSLLFNLENETGSLWGANSYITPPDSQGFKPHYDDVEVFMLQLEGRKRWRIFAGVELARECVSPFPLCICVTLCLAPPSLYFCKHFSRYSPADFQEEELGQPLLDAWLDAGDTLYFPRGTIHYGVTCSEHGSHHLTVSTYQKSCWADMIGDSFKAALAEAAHTDVQFRMGLPLKWTGYIPPFPLCIFVTLWQVIRQRHGCKQLASQHQRRPQGSACACGGLDAGALPPCSTAFPRNFHPSLRCLRLLLHACSAWLQLWTSTRQPMLLPLIL